MKYSPIITLTQFVGIIVMNKTYTQPQKEWLPPLPGRKKLNKTILNKAEERKHSQEDSVVNQNRLATSSDKQTSHLRLTSERKTSQSGNSSRGAKADTPNVLCLKKIEILERQNVMLDKQLLTVKQEINQLRISSRMGEDDSVTISSRATTRRSEDRLLQKTDSRTKINRLDVLRTKIDKQNQKNRKIEKQIDKVRKEIHTTKKLNEQIQTQLKDATDRYKQQENIGSVLDEKISSKNEELRIKKIESIHQQAHLIKDYDSILKKLDKELGDKDKPNTEVKQSRAEFYLTNVRHSNQRQPKSGNLLAQNTPRAKKSAAQMTFLKEKIGQYEAQFKELRQKTGSETIEEVTKKFLQEYEGNFGVYIFINEMNSHLEELKQRNAQLQLRQQQIKTEFEQKRRSRAFNELEASKAKIAKITGKQQQIKTKLQNCNSNYKTIKEFVVSFMDKIPLQEISKKYKIDKNNKESMITPENLLEFLQLILKFKQVMDHIKQGEEKYDKLGSHLTSTNHNADTMINSTRSNFSAHMLEQYLQTAKKETTQDKEQLLSRQDFLRNKDAVLMRKKPSGSKLRVSKS